MPALPQGATLDPVLTEYARNFMNPVYIGTRLFPLVTVQAQAAKYHEYLKSAWYRNEARPRPPKAAAPLGGWRIQERAYACDNWALATDIADEERRRDGDAVVDQNAADYTANGILLCKETKIASQVLEAGNWSSSLDVTGGWAADAATNTFIEDVEDGIEAIRRRTGLRPNVLMMDSKTLTQVKRNTAVLERIKYVERGIISAPLIAAMFDLAEVIIGETIYSTAGEAADGTDFTPRDLWEVNEGKGSAFLCYRSGTPAIASPSAGYLLQWEQIDSYRFRDDRHHKDVVESGANFQPYVVAPDLGHLFYDTIVT
jgi:hypothetical protein